jgi:hypothetical protein
MALEKWLTFEGTDVFHVAPSAYTYQTSQVALDADGSSRAYNPTDTGLDANANAGFPNKGWRSVLAVDPQDHSKPFVQPSGPTQGFFVSKTSLIDPSPRHQPGKIRRCRNLSVHRLPGRLFCDPRHRELGRHRHGEVAGRRARERGRGCQWRSDKGAPRRDLARARDGAGRS